MKKLLFSLLAGLVFLPFVSQSVSAAGIYEIDKAKVGIEANIESFQPNSDSWVNDFGGSVGSQVVWWAVGGRPMPKGAAKDGQSKEVTYSKGIVGGSSEAIAWIFNNPAANTETYIADVMNSAGIVTPAYAQGLGFASLDPILNTWKTFRNMAYLLFVVIFMVIGFLIMMRQKVGGQTVVTAQQAIPQIIITLILVTFSYAIAGLLIDLMYLVMYLLLALFGKTQTKDFLNKSFLSLGASMIGNGGKTAFEAVQNFSEEATTTFAEIGQSALEILGGLSLVVVVSIAIALKVFELFFELLKTYVIIILTIAFSPILLALGAIPGKNVFGQWMKDLVGNLAAFPAVMLVLIIFDELTGNISGTSIETGGFQPPYLFGSGTGGALPFIVGVGMLMIMPEIVKEAKKAMGAKEGIFTQFARDIGGSLKQGWQGGEMVPGLAFTNTSKWAGGGLSGENLTRKGAVVVSTIVGGGTGYLAGAIRPRKGKKGFAKKTAIRWARGSGRFIADKADDQQMFTEGRDERNPKKK
ncbi:MAG: hypothetical protein HN846_03405 [Candidatus Pacebacteria bacterium]|jgi:hypothetical protein|nr:hypothetical protein [Candidatus Paceibacterota bacterium]MBT3512136.1 hypothetical protein [Candidatus Paceibacterota bacterium]MBT4005402.1 hypothetical protein [Candidatus Paceibacterota bacterium]MBT4359111.1 hypothetical protein [Candidatus Paceibacterota bacterium]MBT4680972.1 hypothetical protein [Candidatus Paceibacterota bacterium]